MTSIAEKTLVKLRLEGYMDSELTQSGIEKAVGIIGEGIEGQLAEVRKGSLPKAIGGSDVCTTCYCQNIHLEDLISDIASQQQVIDRLVEALEGYSKQVGIIANKIPPPNEYTPQLMGVEIGMRDSAHHALTAAQPK